MIYLSFDQDWAPEWATQDLVDTVVESGLDASFFVTHNCPSLEAMRASGAFDIGWHPNFLPGSSHGNSMEEVLSTMKGWVPDATGVRAHCLIQGTPHLMAYNARGIRYEASDLRDGQRDLEPFLSWTGVVQLPTFFQDDVYLQRKLPLHLGAIDMDSPGMKIFSFHPVLLSLNTRDLSQYQNLKESLVEKGRALTDATREDFAPFTQDASAGVRDLFESLLGVLGESPEQAGGTLDQLTRVFLAARG